MTDVKIGAQTKRRMAMGILMASLPMYVMSLLPMEAVHAETIVSHENDESAEIHRLTELTELDHRCADKVIQALPLAVVGASQMAVDQISIHIESNFFTIFIPLKKPQGPMTRVFLGTRTFDGAAKLMQVLQSPALKSVKVVAYLPKFGPDVVRASEETATNCAVDQLRAFLEPCAECKIKELAFSGRVN